MHVFCFQQTNNKRKNITAFLNSVYAKELLSESLYYFYTAYTEPIVFLNYVGYAKERPRNWWLLLIFLRQIKQYVLLKK